MAKSYRAPNKRIIHRAGTGRFRRSTLADIGIPQSQIATGKMQCAGCGHVWRPFVTTGICPECGSQEKARISASSEMIEKIDRYQEIKQKYPFGIDPRDVATIDEAQKLFVELRDEGLLWAIEKKKNR